jgi:glycosyltransferase involved in cell wall biosynthesis
MISVIMPTYNRENFVAEAIESILNQTFRDFELIVIDDGSTDRTVPIIQKYADIDDRIKIIQNEHKGVAAARNAGLQTAQYDWIALLDSDDVALPTRLERQMEAINSDAEVIVWGTGFYQIGKTGKVFNQVKIIGPMSKDEFFKKHNAGRLLYMPTTTTIFRKDIAEKVNGYDTRFDTGSDIELFDRMADHGPQVTLREPLSLYRLHNNSITSNMFSNQYMNDLFLLKRRKLQAKGQQLSYDDFVKMYNNQPWYSRFLRYFDKMSRLYYKNAGIHIGNGDYLQGGAKLIVATFFNPALVLVRVWKRLPRLS